MAKVSVIHTSEDLMSLFSKEYEVIQRITPFCNKTGRDIESLYSLTSFNVWRLEIKTISNEREE
jgi:hypothetical protein